MTQAPPPTELLSHATFVRRLAGALLRDDSAADDAAQEAIVRSMERPAARSGEARNWIAAILRNVVRRRHRDDVRLRAREAVAARPESVESAENLAARNEIVRRVAESVGALDEPLRAVVLLRHYEGLAPRDIAVRLGVPVETVKTRLQRAHAKLRASLDERRGGNVEGWRVALAALVGVGAVGRSSASAAVVSKTTGGGIAMGAGTKIGIGMAAAALIGVGAWRITARSTGDASRPVGPPPTVVAGTSTPSTPVAVRPELAVSPDRPAAVPVPIPAPSDLPAGWSRHAIGTLSVAIPDEWTVQQGLPGTHVWGVVGPDGQPKAAFGLMPLESMDPLLKSLAVSSTRSLSVLGMKATWREGVGKGRSAALISSDPPEGGIRGFCFVASAPESNWEAHAETVERVLGLLTSTASQAPPSTPMTATPNDGSVETPTDRELEAMRAAVAGDRVEVHVMNGTRPIVGASIRLVLQVWDPASGRAHAGNTVRIAVTNDDGTFAWTGVEPAPWSIEVNAPGLGKRTTSIQTRIPPEVNEPALIVFGGAEVSGHVYSRTGRPAPGVLVSALPQPRGGSSKTFRVRADTTSDSDGSYRISGMRSGLYLVTADIGGESRSGVDQQMASADLSAHEQLTLDLGSSKTEAEWTGVLRHSTGSVIDDPLTSISLRRIGPSPLFLDDRLAEGGRIHRRLPAGTYQVMIGFAARAQPFKTELVVGDADLVQDLVVLGARVAGVLRDASTGRPFPTDDRRKLPSLVLVTPDANPALAQGVVIDSSGAFRFDGVLPGTYRLVARAPFGRESETPPIDVTVADRDVTGLTVELRLK